MNRLICAIRGHHYRWNLQPNPWIKLGELNLWCSYCQMTFKAEKR